MFCTFFLSHIGPFISFSYEVCNEMQYPYMIDFLWFSHYTIEFDLYKLKTINLKAIVSNDLSFTVHFVINNWNNNYKRSIEYIPSCANIIFSPKQLKRFHRRHIHNKTQSSKIILERKITLEVSIRRSVWNMDYVHQTRSKHTYTNILCALIYVLLPCI